MIIKIFKVFIAILCPKYRRIEVHKPHKIQIKEELSADLDLNFDRRFFRTWKR